MGYVLPYGQMSLWGLPVFLIAPDAYLIINNFIFIVLECLDKTINEILYHAYATGLFKLENLTLLSSITRPLPPPCPNGPKGRSGTTNVFYFKNPYYKNTR